MCDSYKKKSLGAAPNWMSQHLGEIPIVFRLVVISIVLYIYKKYIKNTLFPLEEKLPEVVPLRGQCPLNLKSNGHSGMCTLWYVNAILLFFFSLSLKHTPHSFIKKQPSKIILEFQQYWLALKKAVEGFEMRV